MSIANQNIGKLHSYEDPHFNTEFDRIYDFLARVKFPDNSVDGVKLRDGSVAERKLGKRVMATDHLRSRKSGPEAAHRPPHSDAGAGTRA